QDNPLQFRDLVLTKPASDELARNGRSLGWPDLIALAIATGAQVLQLSTHARVRLGIGLKQDETVEGAVYAITQPVQTHAGNDRLCYLRVKRAGDRVAPSNLVCCDFSKAIS